jgi:hypothetical protein
MCTIYCINVALCREGVVAITEVQYYIMTKEDFKSRLRPSIVQSVKSMAVLRKRWRAGRSDFLVTNPVAKTVAANVHKEIPKNPLVPSSELPDKKNLELLKKEPKQKSLSKLRTKAIAPELTPVKSISAGSIIQRYARQLAGKDGHNIVKTSDKKLRAPKGVDVPHTPIEALRTLDNAGVLEQRPEFGSGLEEVLASERYLHLFTNNEDYKDRTFTTALSIEEPQEAEVCTLNRSFGTWLSTLKH